MTSAIYQLANSYSYKHYALLLYWAVSTAHDPQRQRGNRYIRTTKKTGNRDRGCGTVVWVGSPNTAVSDERYSMTWTLLYSIVLCRDVNTASSAWLRFILLRDKTSSFQSPAPYMDHSNDSNTSTRTSTYTHQRLKLPRPRPNIASICRYTRSPLRNLLKNFAECFHQYIIPLSFVLSSHFFFVYVVARVTWLVSNAFQHKNVCVSDGVAKIIATIDVEMDQIRWNSAEGSLRLFFYLITHSRLFLLLFDFQYDI